MQNSWDSETNVFLGHITANAISSGSVAVVYVPRPAVGWLRGPETPLWFKRSFITWERTGSLLEGIIRALALFPSVWQESLGWKGKKHWKKRHRFPTWRSLCFYSLHPESLQESSFPPFNHPSSDKRWPKAGIFSMGTACNQSAEGKWHKAQDWEKVGTQLSDLFEFARTV